MGVILTNIQNKLIKGGIGVSLLHGAGAIDAGSGGVLQNGIGLPAEINDVLGAKHIGPLQILIVAGMADIGSGVDHHVHILDQLGILPISQAEMRRCDVTDHGSILEMLAFLGEIVSKKALQPLFAAYQTNNLQFALQQLPQNMAAQKAGGTGQQHTGHLPVPEDIGIMGDIRVNIGFGLVLVRFFLVDQHGTFQRLGRGILVDILCLDAQNRSHFKGSKAVTAHIKEVVLDTHVFAAQHLLKGFHDLLLQLGFRRHIGNFLFLHQLLDHLHGFLTLDLQCGGFGEFPGYKVQGGHPLVGGQRGVDILDLLLDVFQNRLVVDIRRMNGSRNLSVALINHDVPDAFNGHNVGFQFLGVDIFAVAENDQVFGTAGDVQIAVIVKMAQIAGAEIAVLGEGFRGGFRVLIVAEHNTGALDNDLAFADLHIHIRNRLTDRIQPVHIGIVGGDQRRALCQTIALVHIDAEILKRTDDLCPKRSAAHDHIGQSAAEFLQQASEQEPAGIDAEKAQNLAQLSGQQEFGFVATGLNAIHHFFIEGFRNGRNHQDHTGTEPLQVGHDILHLIVKADRCAAINHAQIVNRQFKGMINGQHRQYHRLVLQVLCIVQLVDLVDIGDDVSLADHNALADAGGAGSKQDLRQGIRINGRQLHMGGVQDLLISRIRKTNDLLDLVLRVLNPGNQIGMVRRKKDRIRVAHDEQI